MNPTQIGRRMMTRGLRVVPVSALASATRARPLRRAAHLGLLERDATIRSGPGAGLRFNSGWSTGDYVLGTYEVPIQQAIASHIRRGDVAYDIGANAGFFTVIAARACGPSGAVVAFDPDGENARLIAHNARLNGFANVTVVPAAISDREGTATLHLAGISRGHSLRAEFTGGSQATVEVPVTTVDAVVHDAAVPPPTFVKVDAEGEEEAVLRGMERTLAVHRPVVLVEVDDHDRERWQHRWRSIDDTLESAGYECRHLEAAYPGASWCVGHTLAVPGEAAR